MTNNPPEVLSCGAVIVRWDRKEFRYLLLKAYNFWDFPKGRVEAGETSMQTALREVREETTIRDLTFPWGKDYYETDPYFRGKKVARYYLAETRRRGIRLPINPEIGRPEHSAWAWFTRTEALKRVTPRVQEVILWSDTYLAYDRRVSGSRY